MIYQKGEITFSRDAQNVVYGKFDFDVWHRTGRQQKSNGPKNRPTPGILFSKHPVFHFAPMFHFAPTYYTCLLLLISMLWHGQAIFESKGDKLSSSAECRIDIEQVSPKLRVKFKRDMQPVINVLGDFETLGKNSAMGQWHPNRHPWSPFY